MRDKTEEGMKDETVRDATVNKKRNKLFLFSSILFLCLIPHPLSLLYAPEYKFYIETSSTTFPVLKDNFNSTLDNKKSIQPLAQGTQPSSQATSFALSQSTRTRVITPNGDGVNDTFILTFDNPEGNVISQKKIYDIRGAEVADFQVNGDETALLVTLVWDGRDKNGEIVRSGIYIYQVQAEGKVINGTIVVAR